MRHAFVRLVVRRVLLSALLVLLVASTALLLIRLAPGNHLSGFELDPATAAAERERLGLDRPFAAQYGSWLLRALVLDLGESLKYRRPVRDLIVERAANTALLGAAALALATLVGIPAGIVTGSRRGATRQFVRTGSILLLSTPPLVTSFGLLLLASTTGWFPVGGLATSSLTTAAHHLILPALALGLPIAAALERLQAQAMIEALGDPSVRAARARGCSPRRIIWRHALRLSLGPVLALYGVIVGGVLSGSFAVEIVMSWPGLGALTYEALVARDLYLVAGCAAAAAFFLAAGILASDLAVAVVDPRIAEGA